MKEISIFNVLINLIEKNQLAKKQVFKTYQQWS